MPQPAGFLLPVTDELLPLPPALTAAPSGDSTATAVVAEEVSFGIDRSGT
jgi:hypothetical protein